jgi:hypothetical protein
LTKFGNLTSPLIQIVLIRLILVEEIQVVCIRVLAGLGLKDFVVTATVEEIGREKLDYL